MSKQSKLPIGPTGHNGLWINSADHQTWLKSQSENLFDFFMPSMQDTAGFCLLDHDGTPLATPVQELHTTTRMIHSYALGALQGHTGASEIVDHGMRYLNEYHKDALHGGYLWSLDGKDAADGTKLAYGHMFVLLAASSAKQAGHPDADALIDDITDVLDRHFWEDEAGLFCDEWNRDWTPFSNYRGMNANMHGVEALLAAYEATDREVYLTRAGRILDFFVGQLAPAENGRLPEHFTSEWAIDRGYAGNHMFRPAGTTPGHSFELGRLALQHWDLTGRPLSDRPSHARNLIETALYDAWLPQGGFAYTLNFDGSVADGSRFWWPVTEAINALATLLLIDGQPADEEWYRKVWRFADSTFIDHAHGGWFPAIDGTGAPTSSIFTGKPDIYHALQACLFPVSGRVSRMFTPVQ